MLKHELNPPNPRSARRLGLPAPRSGSIRYPFSKALVYHLLNSGDIKSYLVHKPGSIRGIRLVSIAEIEAFLARLAREQQGEGFTRAVPKEYNTGPQAPASGGQAGLDEPQPPTTERASGKREGASPQGDARMSTSGCAPPGRKRRLRSAGERLRRARNLRLTDLPPIITPLQGGWQEQSKVLAAMTVLCDSREQKPHPWAALLPPGWSLERAALWRLLASQFSEGDRRRAQARRALRLHLSATNEISSDITESVGANQGAVCPSARITR